MNDERKQIELLYKYQNELGYIEKIEMFRDKYSEGSADFIMEIILSDYPFCEKSPKLVLKCNGIKQLEIRNIDNLCKAYISIDDIRNFQMEDIGYVVKETENNFFSFVCKDFCVDLKD